MQQDALFSRALCPALQDRISNFLFSPTTNTIFLEQAYFSFSDSEKELLRMVRDVSEDQVYDTIEFNEFLQMMSKQQRFGLNEDSLREAFK